MTDDRRRIHKPTKFLGRGFEAFHDVEDPVQDSRVAHETAAALLERVPHESNYCRGAEFATPKCVSLA